MILIEIFVVKTLRLIAWILRFLNNNRKTYVINSEEITAKEIIATELFYMD